MSEEALRELDGGIAVGVDGSEDSLHALRAAADEAVRRAAPLHVIRAWSMRNAPRPEDCPRGVVPSIQQYSDTVRERLDALLLEELGANPPFELHVHVVHAPAPQTLLAASDGVDLLVVGYRGHGGFAGLKLGSVAEQCVRHALCSVLVIRPNT